LAKAGGIRWAGSVNRKKTFYLRVLRIPTISICYVLF